MTHEQAIERLDDFGSGELPDIETRLVERHLEGCEECRAEAEAIRALLAEVATLPAGIAPPTDLWQAIAPRLEPRAAEAPVAEETKVIPFAPRRKVWEPPRWALQIAAALVLVVGSSVITMKVMQQEQPGGIATLPSNDANAPSRGTRIQDGGTTTNPTAIPVSAPAGQTGSGQMTALAAFRPAEREYQRAVDELAQALETRRADLAPETVATLERSLAIIDAAIAESRQALERDPNSRELTRMLSTTYDAKVQLLRNAVQL
jgi:hypothetical protein